VKGKRKNSYDFVSATVLLATLTAALAVALSGGAVGSEADHGDEPGAEETAVLEAPGLDSTDRTELAVLEGVIRLFSDT